MKSVADLPCFSLFIGEFRRTMRIESDLYVNPPNLFTLTLLNLNSHSPNYIFERSPYFGLLLQTLVFYII